MQLSSGENMHDYIFISHDQLILILISSTKMMCISLLGFIPFFVLLVNVG